MPHQNMYTSYALVSDQISSAQIKVILDKLKWALNTTDGAVVEFGCYIGTTSLFIRRSLDARNEGREFHVYDSFEGLPPKTIEDSSGAGEQFQAGELSVSKKQFIQEFRKAKLELPVIHKGWFRDLMPANIPEKIAFAFLDGDFYSSIRDSLQLVMPRLQPGGIIVIDDYAREALPGVARAVHEVLPGRAIRTERNLGIYYDLRKL